MGNNRRALKVGDVCDFVGGSQPPKASFKYQPEEGYVRLIQTRDYKTDQFVTYIRKSSTKKFCSSSDIMIGRYGPPIFQILRGLEGAYNVALMKAIPRPGVSNGFLYYFLRQTAVFEYVDKLSIRTGGQTGVDVEALKQYPIALPDSDEQEAIANVLSALDAKIELNQRMNEELAGMARLLYDYWFVQYDFPMSAAQAAALGKPHLTAHPYRASGGPMTYHETLKREIPQGWEMSTLSDFANITMGQSPPGDSYNQEGKGSVFFQGSTDFGWRYPDVREYTTAPSRLAKAGDILLSVRAPVGTLNIADRDCCIGRGLAALHAKTGHNSFLFEVMLYFKTIFDRRNTSGTTFGSITKDDLHELMFARPPFSSPLLDEFESKTKPMHQAILTNHQQTQELTTLRDWLLPMLMNGQVTVG